MQFLPTTNILSAQSSQNTKKASAKDAYSGIMDLQTGKSTKSFKSIMDSAEIRADKLEKGKEARTAIETNSTFWQADRNTLARANQFIQENQNATSKTNTKDTSTKSQKTVAEVFAKELNTGIEGKDKKGDKEDYSSIANFISPYTMHTQVNSYTEMPRLKSSEVDGIIAGMKENGYNNPKVLNALEEAGKSLLGVTGEELARAGIEALTANVEKPTAAQERQLLSIAQKLNDHTMSDEDLLSKMKNTNPVQLLNGIAAVVETKGSITFTKEEINALASSLQLSDSEEKKITNLVKDTNSLTVDKQSFNEVFAPAREEITAKTEAMLELGEMIINELPKAEKAAEARVNFENGIEAKSEKLVDNTKTLLETELLKNGLETLQESVNSSNATLNKNDFAPTAQAKEEVNSLANANANTHLNNAQVKQGVETKLFTNAKDVVEIKYTEDTKETKDSKDTKEVKDTSTTNTRVSNTNQTTQFAMLTKPVSQDVKASTQLTMSDSLRNAVDVSRREEAYVAQNAQEKRETSLLNNAEARAEAFAQEMNNLEASNEFHMEEVEIEAKLFSQVEEAVTEAVKNKVSKLEVKLNPVELGVMNVVITSKNGELTALIQPEKVETMDMLNKQIDAMKAELEGQGIKFDSIEVELSSSEDSNQLADGQLNQDFSNPHGSQSQQSQEQMESQLNDLARLRLLGRGIASGAVDVESLSQEDRELVQNLHNENVAEGRRESLSDSVFDIVA